MRLWLQTSLKLGSDRIEVSFQYRPLRGGFLSHGSAGNSGGGCGTAPVARPPAFRSKRWERV